MHRTMAVSLMQWNANGLLSKQSEFKQHVANNDYDVICIQETFLKQNKQIRIPGYDTFRSDRLEAKGGLMERQRTIIEANMYSISVMLVRYSLTAKMAVF